MQHIVSIMLLALCLTCSGCGVKGELYLPEQQSE